MGNAMIGRVLSWRRVRAAAVLPEPEQEATFPEPEPEATPPPSFGDRLIKTVDCGLAVASLLVMGFIVYRSFTAPETVTVTIYGGESGPLRPRRPPSRGRNNAC